MLTARLAYCARKGHVSYPASARAGIVLIRELNVVLSSPMIQFASDPAQHFQGVAFVIGIFQAADHRCRGADELGKLSLGEPRSFPEFADIAGDFFVRSRLFQAL